LVEDARRALVALQLRLNFISGVKGSGFICSIEGFERVVSLWV
jgi:hypothetical protein